MSQAPSYSASLEAPASAERREARPVRVRDRLVYAIGRATMSVVNRLPELPAYWLVGAVGRLYFRCSKRRQRYALRYLRNAYPDRSDKELLTLGRVATGNVFKVSLDTMRVIPWLQSGRLSERLDFGGLENSPEEGPFLGLTAHLGSWEVGAIAMAMLRGESHVIARAFRNPLLNDFIMGNRRKAGLFVHPKRGGIKELIKALDRGCVGMQVVDQHQRLRGVRAPVFGQEASCERAAAVLAVRKRYPIFIAAVARVGPGFRFRGFGFEPFYAEVTGDFEADVVRTVTEVNRRLEQLILDHPEQYLWIHNRYRDKPRTDDQAS